MVALRTQPPGSLPLTLAHEALRAAVRQLQAAQVQSASLDARMLLEHVLGVSRENLLARDDLRLSSLQESAYQALIVRRAQHQPVAQLIGKREFWGLMMSVSPATLIPRPDSETIIEALLERLADREARLRLLDLGTGTGCLLLALLSEFPQATGTGVDISEQALQVARNNAQIAGLAQRANWQHSCWLNQVIGEFDVIIANPPYIPTSIISTLAPDVAEFEPMLALDGGEDGLDAYRAILQSLPHALAKDGVAAFEIGMGQLAGFESIITAAGMRMIGTRKDLGGIIRCVLVTHQ